MAVGACLWAGDPLAAAVGEGREAISRRSRFEAHKGQPRCMRLMKPTFRSRAAVAKGSGANATLTPAARSRLMPAPLTARLGSPSAMTTRAMPASIKASAQGGVRPWCEQGSSVTTRSAALDGCATRLCVPQSHDLGMRPARLLRETFADHLTVAVQQAAAHARLGSLRPMARSASASARCWR